MTTVTDTTPADRHQAATDDARRAIDETPRNGGGDVLETMRAALDHLADLHWILRENGGECHVEIVELSEFTDADEHDIEAARRHLALHRRVIDLFAVTIGGFQPPNDDRSDAGSLVRAGLSAAFGTDRLAEALARFDVDPFYRKQRGAS